MKKSNKIIILGPDISRIGGISECIKSLLESKLGNEFELYHFKTDVIFKGNLISKLYKKLVTFLSFIKLLVGGYGICHIHSSSYFGFFERVVYALFCKLFRIKVIFHIHGGEFLKFYHTSSLQWLIRAFLSKIDYVIYVDKKFKSTFSNRKSKYIPNMISMPEIRKTKNVNSEHVFLSVSVLEKRKNIDQIIKCCKELERNSLTYKLYICGDGPEKDNLEKLVADYNLTKSVVFFGSVCGESKSDVFNKANTFILASSSESFGIVLLESLSFGIDIISTPVGIAPELSLNLDNVQLFDVNDNDELIRLMKHKIEKNKELSLPNFKSIDYCKKHYSIDAIESSYSDIYKEVLNEY